MANCAAANIEPLCYTLSPKFTRQYCDYCFAKLTEDGIICNGCQKIRYCSKKCKDESYERIHKYECDLLKSYGDYASIVVRLWSHLIIHIKCKLRPMVQYYSETEFVSFDNYGLPQWEIKKDYMLRQRFLKNYEDLQHYLKAKPEWIPDIETAKYQFYHLMYTTVIIPSNHMDDIIGFGMYLILAMMQHKCEPTAILNFIGRKMFINVITDPPYKLYIPDVSICYSFYFIVQHHSDVAYRSSCTCGDCFGQQRNNAIKCPKENCDGYIKYGLNKCPYCHKNLSKLQKKTIKNKIDAYTEYLEMLDLHTVDITVLQEAIQDLIDICHPYHFLIFTAVSNAAVYFSRISQYSQAIYHYLYTIRCYEYFHGPYHPWILKIQKYIIDYYCILEDYTSAYTQGKLLYAKILKINDPTHYIYTNLRDTLFDIEKALIRIEEKNLLNDSTATDSKEESEIISTSLNKSCHIEEENTCAETKTESHTRVLKKAKKKRKKINNSATETAKEVERNVETNSGELDSCKVVESLTDNQESLSETYSEKILELKNILNTTEFMIEKSSIELWIEIKEEINDIIQAVIDAMYETQHDFLKILNDANDAFWNVDLCSEQQSDIAEKTQMVIKTIDKIEIIEKSRFIFFLADIHEEDLMWVVKKLTIIIVMIDRKNEQEIEENVANSSTISDIESTYVSNLQQDQENISNENNDLRNSQVENVDLPENCHDEPNVNLQETLEKKEEQMSQNLSQLSEESILHKDPSDVLKEDNHLQDNDDSQFYHFVETFSKKVELVLMQSKTVAENAAGLIETLMEVIKDEDNCEDLPEICPKVCTSLQECDEHISEIHTKLQFEEKYSNHDQDIDLSKAKHEEIPQNKQNSAHDLPNEKIENIFKDLNNPIVDSDTTTFIKSNDLTDKQFDDIPEDGDNPNEILEWETPKEIVYYRRKEFLMKRLLRSRKYSI